MKSWKLTLGKALSSAGATVSGIGIVPQVIDEPSRWLNYVVFGGAILNVFGSFFSNLFVEDQQELIKLSQMHQEPIPVANTMKSATEQMQPTKAEKM